MISIGRFLAFAGPVMLACFFPTLCQAEDFRIETKVYVGEEEQPVSENVTLFYEGKVYDFMSDPVQIAVFKPSRTPDQGRFILISPDRKQRTELKTDRILKFMTRLKAWAATQQDPLLKFSSNPQFEEKFDQREGTFDFLSKTMSYRLTAVETRTEEASKQYRQFSDWYARMGAMLHPGAVPPFARLKVNSALSEYQVIPSEVHLTIPASRPHRKRDLEVRSEHRIAWRLSQKDRQRIEQANEHLVNFDLVDLDQFQR